MRRGVPSDKQRGVIQGSPGYRQIQALKSLYLGTGNDRLRDLARQHEPSQCRVYRTDRWEERLINAIGVGDVVKAAVGVRDSGRSIVPHPQGPALLVIPPPWLPAPTHA